jgi:regulator of protease activity HflC (stomatin/prohibitin superfamily)
MSRYATGLSTESRYKPLRAGGSSLLGVAVFCFAVAICLALVQFKFPIPAKAIAIIIPCLLIALGIETALNVVLDIYRPRIKGQYARAAFDSRLLGIINEPGEILHTVAGAIDYQFGFKVSQTWFYQLLERAIVPLILFGAVCVYLLSCIVVVNPNEQAIIERFGNPVGENGQVRQLGPGLAFKYPWPIDIAYKYPTKQIKEIYIGYVPKIDPKTKLPQRERQLLWGKEHYEAEHSVLVASQQTGENISAGAVPVSLIKANVPVQYRVKDLYSYLYKHNEPEKLLESICYRELARFAASAKIEVDTPQQMEQSILGAGRSYAKKTLTERIQAAADSRGLGIEIIFVGLQGIHPPPDVAADYQKVVSSVQKKYAAVLDAHTQRNSILSNLTGSIGSAEELYGLALEYQQAQQDNRPDAEKIGQSLDSAFTQASGDIFKTLAEAKSYSFERATIAKADGQRFADQLKPYRAAPDIYERNLRLEIFEQSLDKARKYVVVADQNDMQVFIVDVEEKLTPSLYDITGLEEPTGP